MAKIKVNENEYELKYTLESWKKLKKEYDITPTNFQVKLEEDMAGALSSLIYYGLLPKVRETIQIDELDECLEFKVMDTVSKAILEGLPEKVEPKDEGKAGQEDSGKK